MVEHHLNEFKSGQELRDLIKELSQESGETQKVHQKLKKELQDL
jgi:uncharacterized protein YukE